MFSGLKKKLAALRKSGKSRLDNTSAKTKRDCTGNMTTIGTRLCERMWAIPIRDILAAAPCNDACHGKAFKGLLERYFGK